MTRWRAQTLATVLWLVFALLASRIVDSHAHGFFAVGPSSLWLFFLPVALAATLVTSLTTLLWGGARAPQIALLHGALALGLAVFLRAVT